MMLCDGCNRDEAIYSVSVLMGGEVVTRHLCPSCMSKMNQNISASNIRGLLSSILTAITGSEAKKDGEEAKGPDPVCPTCQTAFSQVTRTGHLGCPACYEAFRDQLQPMLLQIHGRVQHAGRRPLCSEDAQRLRKRQEELTRRLEQAIAMEDYETAAALRDRIRSLRAEEVGE